MASQTYAGYGGVFNVTSNSIMLAHPDTPHGGCGLRRADARPTSCIWTSRIPAARSSQRGTLQVDGVVDTSGADEGRWGLDFADGKTAHVVGCASGQYGCGGTTGAYILATGDFTNPNAPVLDSELSIPATGWSVTARFDSGRMYLSPNSDSYAGTTTPLQVYDLSNPTAPTLAGQTQLPGTVWLMVPSRQSALRARQQRDFELVARGPQLPGRHQRRFTGAHRHVYVRRRLGVDAGGRHVQGLHDGLDPRARGPALQRVGRVQLGLQQRRPAHRVQPDDHHNGRRRSYDRLGRARHLRRTTASCR